MKATVAISRRERELKCQEQQRAKDDAKVARLAKELRLRKRAEADVALEESRAGARLRGRLLGRQDRIGWQHLQRDDAPDRRILGAIDDAHGALADELLDDVGPQPGSRGDWHGPRLCECLLADRQS